MKELPESPWPSFVKVALILGCTTLFCVLGLAAGVVAVTAMNSARMVSDSLLQVILIPPAIGALFGAALGLICSWFVRWKPRAKPTLPPQVELGSR